MNIPGKQLFEWYQTAKKSAIANDVDPEEVAWLLQTVTSLSSLTLRLGSFERHANVVSDKPLSELDQLWQKRLQECFPVQYLVETVFWRRFKLKVTPAVLIPRPETELIIDIIQKIVQQQHFLNRPGQHWVDLGTGSGAIALGLADLLPQANIHAIDISQDALAVAQENAANLQLENICFYQGNWWNPVNFLKGKVRGMISNPPYIPTVAVTKLEPEVVCHEPNLALDGGVDGLDDIRHLVKTAPEYLLPGGIWLIELMIGQSRIVLQLLEQQEEYYDVNILTDLSGVERFILAFRR